MKKILENAPGMLLLTLWSVSLIWTLVCVMRARTAVCPPGQSRVEGAGIA